MKNRLPGILPLVFCFAAFGACAVGTTERETAPPPASVASVETFPPDSVRAIFKRSCESCHGYDGRGIAGVAPDMMRTFGHKAEEWESYFINPKGLHPGAQMPSTIWMSQDEIKAVANFLANLNERAAVVAEPSDSR